MACNSDKLSTSLPSLAVAVMAAKMALRLSSFTPVSPSRAKSAAVKAGLGVTPLAVSMMPCTMRARLANSAWVSTEPLPITSMASFSKLASAVVSTVLRPSNWYCAALSAGWLLSTPSAPPSSWL